MTNTLKPQMLRVLKAYKVLVDELEMLERNISVGFGTDAEFNDANNEQIRIGFYTILENNRSVVNLNLLKIHCEEMEKILSFLD